MATLFPGAVDSQLPEGVLGLLNGTRGTIPQPDTDLVNGFFGPNIRMHNYEDMAGDFPLPYLAVLWSTIDEAGQISDLVRGQATVMLEGRFPRQVARRPEIALPIAPVLTEISGDMEPGTYVYGVTNFTSAGEGYGGPVSEITIGAGKAVRISGLTGSGQRLWRTPVNRRYMQYLDVPSTTSYDDDHDTDYLGGEMFPESALVERVFSAIRRILNATLFVPDENDNQLTSGVLTFKDDSDKVDARRNARIKRVAVIYPDIQFSAYTREAE